MVVEQIQGSTPYYVHPDRQGSVRKITDSSRTVKNSYAYDAYGTMTSSSETITNRFGYTGQYKDAETGFYYLRARYYDPATQQFLTVDPLLAVTGDAYNYAGGSPTNASDPSGMIPADDVRCRIAHAEAWAQPMNVFFNVIVECTGTVRRIVTGLNVEVEVTPGQWDIYDPFNPYGGEREDCTGDNFIAIINSRHPLSHYTASRLFDIAS